MKVVSRVEELDKAERAVVIGTFDGVHRGHQQVIATALGEGLRSTVVTFAPHPRTVLGNRVELLATVERRLELIAELGVDETLLLEFTLDLAAHTPEEFAEEVLRRIGARVVIAGPTFRFGRKATGDLDLLRELGFDVRTVALVDTISARAIRGLLREGEIVAAAGLLGRPPELEGTVAPGDRRGGTLGFPTANLSVEPDLLVPREGVYAGAADGHQAAISIGTNPHYGGDELRIEAFLLDFEGDLYGHRLRLELWDWVRAQQVFSSEDELVAAIADDVSKVRAATRPG
jgi:riboflavin kinase / FMN adenylyltransferase